MHSGFWLLASEFLSIVDSMSNSYYVQGPRGFRILYIKKVKRVASSRPGACVQREAQWNHRIDSLGRSWMISMA